MKEDKKIGYSALIVGLISLWCAWVNIIDGHGEFLEVLFLGLGLVASLLGIGLIGMVGVTVRRRLKKQIV